uniref:T-box domain-containing protein n=1 Tax=Ditylenchus dipsaci TaxID=166011 RepID=A0A915EI89_9BILA
MPPQAMDLKPPNFDGFSEDDKSSVFESGANTMNHNNFFSAALGNPAPPPYCMQPSIELKRPTDCGISVELANKELWKKFHKVTNEMVVTKPGRKMFPKIELKIKGLNPRVSYMVVIEMQSVDNCRYKFQAGGWSPSGQDDLPETTQKVPHHDGPVLTGEFWMKSSISFDRLKLTNKANAEGGSQISLVSMHKYQPVISIYDMSSERKDLKPIYTFTPKETQFIAVTAYQSENIIKLKVQHNPFAKGFREGSVRKRSLSISPDSECSPSSSSSGTSSNMPHCEASTSSLYRDPITSSSQPNFPNLPFPPYYNFYSNAMASMHQPNTSSQSPVALAAAAVAAGFSANGHFGAMPNFGGGNTQATGHSYWNSPLYQQFLYQQMLNP